MYTYVCVHACTYDTTILIHYVYAYYMHVCTYTYNNTNTRFGGAGLLPATSSTHLQHSLFEQKLLFGRRSLPSGLEDNAWKIFAAFLFLVAPLRHSQCTCHHRFGCISTRPCGYAPTAHGWCRAHWTMCRNRYTVPCICVEWADCHQHNCCKEFVRWMILISICHRHLCLRLSGKNSALGVKFWFGCRTSYFFFGGF